jgi:cytochrome c oxidase subunit II
MNRKFVALAGTILMSGVVPWPLAADQPQHRIDITAQRFSFTPNEITIKKGQEVTLVIRSADVSHGLVIEDLGVKTEVKKGQTAEVTFTAATAGTFGGKCAHFCGKGHGSMKLVVHVTE